jgi:hypothetical protein
MICQKAELLIGYNMNSILEQVNSVCNLVRKNCDYPISFKTLLSKTRRIFKNKDFDLTIKSKRQKFLTTEEFYVNAYYDAEDDSTNETPIEVLIFHNFDDKMLWDRKQVTDLLIQLFDAVVHELRHQRQSRSRKHVVYSEHEQEPYHRYLADPDELDAYAISIAIELCRNLGKHRALRYMGKLSSLSRFKIQKNYVSPNLNAYISHFGGVNNKLIKRLAKKVYIRLKKIDTDYIFV